MREDEVKKCDLTETKFDELLERIAVALRDESTQTKTDNSKSSTGKLADLLAISEEHQKTALVSKKTDQDTIILRERVRQGGEDLMNALRYLAYNISAEQKIIEAVEAAITSTREQLVKLEGAYLIKEVKSPRREAIFNAISHISLWLALTIAMTTLVKIENTPTMITVTILLGVAAVFGVLNLMNTLKRADFGDLIEAAKKDGISSTRIWPIQKMLSDQLSREFEKLLTTGAADAECSRLDEDTFSSIKRATTALLPALQRSSLK